MLFYFFSSRRRHTRLQGDWSSDVCSSDLPEGIAEEERRLSGARAALAATTPDAPSAPPSLPPDPSPEAQRLRAAARSEERRVGKECRSRWQWWEKEATETKHTSDSVEHFA